MLCSLSLGSIGSIPGAEGVRGDGVVSWDMSGWLGVEFPGWVLGLWGNLLPWAGRAPAPIMFGVLPFPSPGDLLNPGIKPWSPAFQADSLPGTSPG